MNDQCPKCGNPQNELLACQSCQHQFQYENQTFLAIALAVGASLVGIAVAILVSLIMRYS